MRILEAKMEPVKNSLIVMFDEVLRQIIKSQSALSTLDQDLALEILEEEKKIDEMEVQMFETCEEFIALNNPVADDLRLIMAINNIAPSLERIGDIVEKIAKYVKKYSEPLPFDLQEHFKIDDLYEITINMYQMARKAFIENSTKNVKTIIKEDKKVNKINKQAKKVVVELIQKFPDKSAQSVNLLLIIAKIERIGDLVKNIAEEITFYIEARSIKHR